MKPGLLAGLPLLAVYTGSIVAANWVTGKYGLQPVGFGLVAPAGTMLIGGVIMTRDLLQDAIGRAGVLLAILAGALLSWLIAPHAIAEASGATFLAAETLEYLVYSPLRRKVRWGTGVWGIIVAIANLCGIVTDTLVFLNLAGFPLTGRVIAGQLLGKTYVTVAVVLLGCLLRACMRKRPAPVKAGTGRL